MSASSLIVGSGSAAGSELVDEATEEEVVLVVDDFEDDVVEVAVVDVLGSDSSALPQAVSETATAEMRQRMERRLFMPKAFRRG